MVPINCATTMSLAQPYIKLCQQLFMVCYFLSPSRCPFSSHHIKYGTLAWLYPLTIPSSFPPTQLFPIPSNYTNSLHGVLLLFHQRCPLHWHNLRNRKNVIGLFFDNKNNESDVCKNKHSNQSLEWINTKINQMSSISWVEHTQSMGWGDSQHCNNIKGTKQTMNLNLLHNSKKHAPEGNITKKKNNSLHMTARATINSWDGKGMGGLFFQQTKLL